MARELNPRELAALEAFAAEHGSRWKDKLREVYWYNARIWGGDPGALLHSLRNDPSWGHEGLATFRFDNPRYSPTAVEKAIQASNRAGRHIGAKEARAIHSLLKGR